MKQADTTPAIAAAIIVNDGRVLLVRRRVGEGELMWQFPAGAVEENETAPVAAAREAGEEVGLEVRPAQVLGSRVHPKTGRSMVYVACQYVGGDARVVDAEELAEVAWATLDEIETYVPYGVYPPVQEYLSRVLSSWPRRSA